MSDNESFQPSPMSMVERRVLGVFVEKAKTTPDVYPMSVNSIMTGCNQKSNRDPILSLSEEAIEETLDQLQMKKLATKIIGGRVIRWRHNLYDLWDVDKVELAILTELLLRGPQTEGELRTRASRMEPIEDLDQLRAVLKPLAERKMVVFLGQEGKRGTQITHGFHTPHELESIRSRTRSEEAEIPVITASRGPDPSTGLREEIAKLQEEMRSLQDALAQIRGELQQLKSALGA